jgi:cation/acetate symporter
VYGGVIKRGRSTERQEIYAGRVAVIAIGIVGIVLAEAAGKGFNVQLLTGLTFSVAASANFPSLLLALTWRRFNRIGAIVGIVAELISSIALIILSPKVWGKPAPFPLGNPAIVSVPIGFIGCIVGSLLTGRDETALERFDEVRVRSATGLGAEVAGDVQRADGERPTAPTPGERERSLSRS